MQTNINLDDILQDIEHLSKDLEKMRFQNNKIYESPSEAMYQQPYRTEMNLILTIDGDQPKFTEKVQSQYDNVITDTDYTDTPPPSIPSAMKLLPNTLPYIKLDQPKDGGVSPTPTYAKVDNELDLNLDSGSATIAETNAHIDTNESIVSDLSSETNTKNVNFVPMANDKENASTRKNFFSKKSSSTKTKGGTDPTKDKNTAQYDGEGDTDTALPMMHEQTEMVIP